MPQSLLFCVHDIHSAMSQSFLFLHYKQNHLFTKHWQQPKESEQKKSAKHGITWWLQKIISKSSKSCFLYNVDTEFTTNTTGVSESICYLDTQQH
ncbi:hypothetical protein PsorP6_004828 [Peronosclerospora sorghi]|uniref:Uncharacterized protein n=1 Tax=Peronosclerospora sorghi TaxID=230839 RepID=A0ACC0VND8_9STRA|nr:hypothetical protein PsorP6_004828 [Peronosclerospora sorghi]